MKKILMLLLLSAVVLSVGADDWTLSDKFVDDSGEVRMLMGYPVISRPFDGPTPTMGIVRHNRSVLVLINFKRDIPDGLSSVYVTFGDERTQEWPILTEADLDTGIALQQSGEFVVAMAEYDSVGVTIRDANGDFGALWDTSGVSFLLKLRELASE